MVSLLLQELNKILGKSLTAHPLGSASFISVSVNAAILQIVGSVSKLIATCANLQPRFKDSIFARLCSQLLNALEQDLNALEQDPVFLL